MLTQKRSDPLQRLGPIDTSMLLCSHQIIFKDDSPLQSNYLEVGIIKPMTRTFYKRK